MLSYNNSNYSSARNHCAAFEKYIALQTTQSSINTFDEFKNMLTLTLTDILWNLFEPIMNNIQKKPTLKEIFIISFNSWGQNL